MEKDQWLMASANTALGEINQKINLREAKAAEFVEMIMNADTVEWDIDLMRSVVDIIRKDYGDVSSREAAVYQMGYMCGERADRKRREAGKA